MSKLLTDKHIQFLEWYVGTYPHTAYFGLAKKALRTGKYGILDTEYLNWIRQNTLDEYINYTQDR